MEIGAMTLIESGRIELLDHWVDHYSRWCKYHDMYVMLVGQEDEFQQELEFLEMMGVNCMIDPRPFHTIATHARVAKWTNSVFRRRGWHFNVDADEFFDKSVDVQAEIREAEKNGKKFIRSVMIDMVSSSGDLPEFDYRDIYQQFPIECQITKRIIGGYDVKDCLLQNPIYGNHVAWVQNPMFFIHDSIHKLHHFKWDASVLQRMRHRVLNKDRFPYWLHFKNFLEYYEKNGHIDLDEYRIDNPAIEE